MSAASSANAVRRFASVQVESRQSRWVKAPHWQSIEARSKRSLVGPPQPLEQYREVGRLCLRIVSNAARCRGAMSLDPLLGGCSNQCAASCDPAELFYRCEFQHPRPLGSAGLGTRSIAVDKFFPALAPHLHSWIGILSSLVLAVQHPRYRTTTIIISLASGIAEHDPLTLFARRLEEKHHPVVGDSV